MNSGTLLSEIKIMSGAKSFAPFKLFSTIIPRDHFTKWSNPTIIGSKKWIIITSKNAPVTSKGVHFLYALLEINF